MKIIKLENLNNIQLIVVFFHTLANEKYFTYSLFTLNKCSNHNSLQIIPNSDALSGNSTIVSSNFATSTGLLQVPSVLHFFLILE